MSDKRTLAIVPARGGSKGLPGKNVRTLAGRPLIGWPIAAALGAAGVSKVIVSTDDVEIAAIAKREGAGVPFMRPDALASDTATSIDVVLHALTELERRNESFDYVILLEPTSPLTDSADVDAALRELWVARDRADAIVGVCRAEAAHPEYLVRIADRGCLQPFQAPDFRSLRRRQELDDIYFLEGSLYASSVEAVRRERSFYHDRTIPYVVPAWKALEIDSYLDFLCVEAVMKNLDEVTAGDRECSTNNLSGVPT